MLRRFWAAKDGGTAIMFAFSVFPLALGVGAAIDYSRASTARTVLQSRVDEAALAVAASGEEQKKRVEQTAERILSQTSKPFGTTARITKAVYDKDTEEVRVEAAGDVPTTFVRLIGLSSIEVGVNATARRANSGDVEIALVLDNTWSMSERDSAGVVKIDALKKSASDLVNQINPNSRSTVKFGLVPYADYVNVGLSNRYRSWVKVAPDYTIPSSQECRTVSSENSCTASGPPKTCTRFRDGVSESYDCTAYSCTSTPVTPREVCSTRPEQKVRWFGCVGSRTTGDLRLNDDEPSSPYPGLLNTWQTCPTEIIPLTTDKSRIVNAIQNLTINSSTYIPAGVVWGLNVLSPSEPFTEGLPYDGKNTGTRKYLVLMTDGENTMALNKGNGTHYGAEGSPTDLAATDGDTAKLCETVKSRKIEVFTIAFAVKSASAKQLLQTCATDAEHYFDAGSSVALAGAFDKIAKSISGVVRLSR